MVLGRKTNFFIGKRWFWRRKPIFSQETDGFGKKTNFFLGKTKKPQKISFGRHAAKVQNYGFFGFP